MTKTKIKISDSFTVEDIRKVRNDFVKRHTDESGKFNWDRATSETEESAEKVRAEIARIRTELNLNNK